MTRDARLTLAVVIGWTIGNGPVALAAFDPATIQAPSVEMVSQAPSLLEATFPALTRVRSGGSREPLNLLVAGTENQIRTIFKEQGWYTADPINALTALRMAAADLSNTGYLNAPMSDLYLYGRKQDLSYQKNSVSVKQRDHLRVWKTPLLDSLGRPFWAIAASKDIAVCFRCGHPDHQIASDVDAERALVLADFNKSDQIALQYRLQSLPPGTHLPVATDGGGDAIDTDGAVSVLELIPKQAIAAGGSDPGP
jgi:hypothetical protein